MDKQVVKDILVKFIKRLNLVSEKFKNKNSEFANSSVIYEFSSLLAIVYVSFMNYTEAAVEALISNCSFSFIEDIIKQVVHNSDKYPPYYLKVRKIAEYFLSLEFSLYLLDMNYLFF